MIRMRYPVMFMMVCILLVPLGCVSASASGAQGDSLWIKAVTLSGLNDDLVPGLIKMHMQEVDENGNPKDEDKYNEVWSALKLGEDGEVEYEILKVIENGEDVTAKEKAREERDENQGDSESQGMEGYNPFKAENQHRISFEPMGSGGVIDGRNTVVYGFTEHTDENVINGRAWLEASTGVPVRVEYTPDPLPKRVKRLITTLDYEYLPPDSLIVRRLVMDATGGILFIKKHFHMNMTLDDYWRLPEQKEDVDTEGE
jgi:hypothetical protein